MKPIDYALAARATVSAWAMVVGLSLGSPAHGESTGPAAKGAETKPQIGEHELMIISDDNGKVLDVMEYVYLGVDGAQLTTNSSKGTNSLAALLVRHAGLPMAQADLANLPGDAIREAALLDQVGNSLSGLDPALPSLPDVYQESAEVATIAQYQAAFEQLHAAYTSIGIDDVETQVRDLDQNGLSDVLLDVLHSGLTPADFVAFWEHFNQLPFFDEIDTTEGDFEAVLDALMVNEQGFNQLLAERGLGLAAFLQRLAQLQLPPSYLLSDAVAYAADPGAFIDGIMAPGDGPDAVVQVPLTSDSAAGTPAAQQDQTGSQSPHIAWQVLGAMGKIGAPVDLIARMKAQGLDPDVDHQPAIDGGLQPEGGVLDRRHPGKPGSWSYDAKTYRFASAGRQLISDVAIDLDAIACARYTNLTPAPGQFARQWQLYLGIASGDPEVILYPSQQANRGSYLGGRNTGNPADVLQVSLERVPLTINPATQQARKQAGLWGGSHRHEVDLLITGDGWAYLLNSLPPDESGRVAPANLARLASTRIEPHCNPHPGVLPGEQGQDRGTAQTPKDQMQRPTQQGNRFVGTEPGQKQMIPATKDGRTGGSDQAGHGPTSPEPEQKPFVEGKLLEWWPALGKKGGLAAAYFKGRQFFFMHSTGAMGSNPQIEAYPAMVNGQGRVDAAGQPVTVHSVALPFNLTATVARGCLYVAWTTREGADTVAWTKWSCEHDLRNWFPKEGPQRIGTIPGTARSVALSSYAEPKPPVGDPTEWLVLLYTTDQDPSHIHVWANSGAGWVGGNRYRRPWNHGEWHSLAALNVTGSEGDESILVAATTSGDGASANQYLLRMQTFNGSWHTRGCYVPLEWIQHNGTLAMAAGTVPVPSTQDQRMVQIFGMNTGRNPQLRHFEFPLLGKHADQGCLLGPVDSGFPGYNLGQPTYPIRIAAVSGFRATEGGSRQFVTVAAEMQSNRVLTATYPSDQYIDLGVANQYPVNTAFGPTRMRSAWTLLGVIEGVPPFTRNGRPVGEINVPVSKVEYSESNEQAITFRNSYSFDLKVGLGGGSIGVSAEVGYGVESIRSSTTTITVTEESFFENDEANEDGEYGYLLFARPSLNNYRYRWLSAAGHEFGVVNQLLVPKYTLGSEPYRLTGDDRYPGLPKRWPTSEPRAWRQGLTPHEGIPAQERIELECGLDPATRGSGKACSFKEAKTDLIATNQTWSVELSAEVKDALKFSSSSSVGLSNALETTKTRAGRAYVTTLPKPEPSYPNPIEKLHMMGYWITPDPKSDEKPYWVPDEFRFQRPWLMTWRVGAIDPDDKGNPEVEPFRRELEALLQSAEPE